MFVGAVHTVACLIELAHYLRMDEHTFVAESALGEEFARLCWVMIGAALFHLRAVRVVSTPCLLHLLRLANRNCLLDLLMLLWLLDCDLGRNCHYRLFDFINRAKPFKSFLFQFESFVFVHLGCVNYIKVLYRLVMPWKFAVLLLFLTFSVVSMLRVRVLRIVLVLLVVVFFTFYKLVQFSIHFFVKSFSKDRLAVLEPSLLLATLPCLS
jgi:hypothetical protein